MRPTLFRGDGSVVLGDLIIKVDGVPVRQVEDLLSEIEDKKEGEIVSLRVLRGCDPSRAETIRVRLTGRENFRNTGRSNTNRRSGFRRNGDISPAFSDGIGAWQ